MKASSLVSQRDGRPSNHPPRPPHQKPSESHSERRPSSLMARFSCLATRVSGLLTPTRAELPAQVTSIQSSRQRTVPLPRHPSLQRNIQHCWTPSMHRMHTAATSVSTRPPAALAAKVSRRRGREITLVKEFPPAKTQRAEASMGVGSTQLLRGLQLYIPL